jgi:hypothetical protein
MIKASFYVARLLFSSFLSQFSNAAEHVSTDDEKTTERTTTCIYFTPNRATCCHRLRVLGRRLFAVSHRRSESLPEVGKTDKRTQPSWLAKVTPLTALLPFFLFSNEKRTNKNQRSLAIRRETTFFRSIKLALIRSASVYATVYVARIRSNFSFSLLPPILRPTWRGAVRRNTLQDFPLLLPAARY